MGGKYRIGAHPHRGLGIVHAHAQAFLHAFQGHEGRMPFIHMKNTGGYAQRAQQERQQYVQWLATAEGLAYYELLKQRFKVQIKAPRPEAVTAAAAEN